MIPNKDPEAPTIFMFILQGFWFHWTPTVASSQDNFARYPSVIFLANDLLNFYQALNNFLVRGNSSE